MYSIARTCPHCNKVSYEAVYTKSIRNFTCSYCGYFEMLVENNKQLNVEEDQGRYLYWCSGEPYGAATIKYKSGNSANIVVSKQTSDSFIDNILYNRNELSNVIISYFKDNKFHTIDLLEYL